MMAIPGEMPIGNSALRSPFALDGRAVTLNLGPFDDAEPLRHRLSLEHQCVALPFDMHPDQSDPLIVPCGECTYGFGELRGVDVLVCNPSPYKDAPGNAQSCTTCILSQQQPTRAVDCSVCTETAVNSAGICQCVT